MVRSWLTHLDCDAIVAGRFLGVRLNLHAGRIVDARVLSAPDAGTLHLGRLESAATHAASGKMTYGWPAYFNALYLPAASNRALLGDVLIGGLPGRLLQVFIDLPGAVLLTRVNATRESLAGSERAEESDTARLRAAQARQFQEVSRELSAARAALAALNDGPTEPIARLVEPVLRLAADASAAQAELRRLRHACQALAAQRRRDERALNDLRESAIVRSLFHALDPVACPRCETPVSPERRLAERRHHACAVCAQPVDGHRSDPYEAKAVEREAEWRLAGSRSAERVAREQLQTAEATATALRGKLSAAERRLAMDDSAGT